MLDDYNHNMHAHNYRHPRKQFEYSEECLEII